MNETVTETVAAGVRILEAESLAHPKENDEAKATGALPLTVIEPARRWGMSGLIEVWRFRELLLFLAWRDIMVRYKQTVLGIGWAVALPLATMLAFSLLLGGVGSLTGGIEHYPLYVFSGMIGWNFFINTVTTGGNSVLANERLITKVYFPRLIIPLATIGVSFFDLLIGFVLLCGMMVFFGAASGWSIAFLPLIVGALCIAAAGFGILFAALIVAQRDFKYFLALAGQLWLLATPCIYLPVDVVSERVRAWLPLNPAYGLVLAFRQSVLGGAIDWYSFLISAAVGTAVFLAGVVYFRRVERSFADLI